MPCDGSLINKGPWTGGKTPDLNTEGRFLRGGSEEDVLELQEDQIQDHQHEDPGHTHGNDPHEHSYKSHERDDFSYSCGSGCHAQHNEITRKTESSQISINESKTNIGGVMSTYRHGSETYPKNMKIVFIMRCW